MPDNLTLNAATIAEFDQQTDGTQQGTITGDGGIEKVGGATPPRSPGPYLTECLLIGPSEKAA